MAKKKQNGADVLEAVPETTEETPGESLLSETTEEDERIVKSSNETYVRIPYWSRQLEGQKKPEVVEYEPLDSDGNPEVGWTKSYVSKSEETFNKAVQAALAKGEPVPTHEGAQTFIRHETTSVDGFLDIVNGNEEAAVGHFMRGYKIAENEEIRNHMISGNLTSTALDLKELCSTEKERRKASPISKFSKLLEQMGVPKEKFAQFFSMVESMKSLQPSA